MKRTLLRCAFVLAAFLVGCDTTTDPPEPKPTEAYVPLARGNEWDYAWDLPEDGEAMNWYVTGYEDGAWRVEFTWGDTAEDWLWRHTDEGEFQARPADEENWRTYLKTPIELDAEWTYEDDDGITWYCKVESLSMFSDTPSGYYEDLVCIAIKDNIKTLINVLFKEDIGIVEVRISDDGDQSDSNWRWKLQDYELN